VLKYDFSSLNYITYYKTLISLNHCSSYKLKENQVLKMKLIFAYLYI